jgi:drug/metabolite transporter (DMT)-like permease
MGFVVKEIPPAWAAFLRFAMAFPFIAAFIAWRKTNLKIPRRILFTSFAISCMTFTQIMLFILGSKHTTGGRVTLFIFTYPLFVPFIAHFLLKSEFLNKQTLIGSSIAFIGVLIPLHNTFISATPTFKGDIIELASSLFLGLLIVTSKYAITHADKWAVFFWQSIGNLVIFGLAAAIHGGFNYHTVSLHAWGWLIFQSVGVSVFAFMSYQWILSKHNSSKVSIFFFATPLCGMILGAILRDEAFDPTLLAGCVAVGIGIFLANKSQKSKEHK